MDWVQNIVDQASAYEDANQDLVRNDNLAFLEGFQTAMKILHLPFDTYNPPVDVQGVIQELDTVISGITG